MRFLLAILLWLLPALAHAQGQGQGMSQALVVSSCGAGVSGSLTNLTMNPQGQLCLTGIGGGTVSAWSTSDATANGMTLSNGGLTVTPSGAGTWQSIRGTSSNNSGKLYYEIKNVGITTAGNLFGFGMANAGFPANTYLGSAIYSAGLYLFGTNYASTGFTVTGTTFSYVTQANDIYSIAVDFSSGKGWIGVNNVWALSGDPVAETGAALYFCACNGWIIVSCDGF